MKTFVESDGVWQELLPSTNRLMSSNTDGEVETPYSTVNTENGQQFAYRIKSQNPFQQQLSLGNDATFTPSIFKYPAKQTKIFPGRIRKRVVLKNGNVNLCKEHIEKRHQLYLQDTFTTMVDIKWRWNLLVFAMGFVLSWLAFAVIWWVICYAHGDFDKRDPSHKWTPCVTSINSFTSAFLFSIETQHTIGYGFRYTTEECPEAIFIMCLQSITGVMIQCFVVGFVFAKLSRPQKRSQTLLFSRNAVICLRDGKLCLMFRVGDVRSRSLIIGASISALVIGRKVTQEGEVIPYYHTELQVKLDNSDSNVFLIWPATVVHVIDENSPFYNMSAEDVVREKFEIVVFLEGTVESTTQFVQARSSYLPSEILWGHRFEQLVSYKRETGEYRVDYGKFNNTYEVETPMCSAKEYTEYQQYLRRAAHTRGASPMDASSKGSDESKASSTESATSSNNLQIVQVPFSSKNHAQTVSKIVEMES
ncbi:ATP-sensitive inward rectifier potassium channel 12-like protein [Dinothrombium tinctorium]|uniref:ATP-sensitive inward rectifier potassium channel 12-like protein n=1 Tax=Dinothrombium tinctorium TaxID=1965070 RepID=A0A443RHB3_9ACAR|nr:ATP-sensitive inward rectifier potassium channel 12-like protein [Dinothrombium tinctorium]